MNTSKLPRNLGPIIVLGVIFLLGPLGSLAHAAALSWDPAASGGPAGGSGTWDTASWFSGDGDGPWVAGDDAFFGGTEGTVLLDNPITAQDLFFNTSGYLVCGSTLTLIGGSVSVGQGLSATIGSVIAGGALTQSGPGTLILNGADACAGTITISSGTLVVGGAGLLGSGGVYAGNIAVSTGALLNYNSTAAQTFSGAISGGGSLAMGGSGTLAIAGVNSIGGGDARGDILGTVRIHQGQIQVGPGGVLTNNGSEIDVGDAAGMTGTLALSGGSAITPWCNGGTSGANVGLNGGVGVVTLSGNSLLDLSCIANPHTGSNVFAVGLAASSGTVTVKDNSILRIAGNYDTLSLGEGGSGVLTIQDQGLVQASILYVGGGLYGFAGGTGSLYLDGGTLSVPAIRNEAGATGDFYFNGGTLQAGARSPNFISGGGTLNAYVQAGGAVIDSNGNDVTIQQPLLHDPNGPAADGGLTKIGAGSLILAASNNFTGGTLVADGMLILDNADALASGSSLTVGADASSIFAPALPLPLAASPAAGVAAVPEPGTLMLFLAAMFSICAIGFRGWRRERRLEFRL